jgi:hypothetical protein
LLALSVAQAGSAEERMLWAVAPTILNDLAHSLELLGEGQCREPVDVRWRRDDDNTPPQAVLRVFPATLTDHITSAGYIGELWLQPGAAPSPGAAVASRDAVGEVCALLGAGNHAMLSVCDVAHVCLVRGHACALKVNPVNEWAGPFIEAALAPLVAAGALRVLYGGPEVGAALTAHHAVQRVHITGSDATYDAIVWGGSGAKKHAGVAPPFRKPVTAELGCVTPYVLVPGAAPWSEADIAAKAGELAAMLANSVSCNCMAPKVLVLAARWRQKDAFLAALRRQLGDMHARAAFYPGAAAKYDAFVAAYPGAEQLGNYATDATDAAGLRALPFTLLPLGPPVAGEKALTEEAWSPVLAVRACLQRLLRMPSSAKFKLASSIAVSLHSPRAAAARAGHARGRRACVPGGGCGAGKRAVLGHAQLQHLHPSANAARACRRVREVRSHAYTPPHR